MLKITSTSRDSSVQHAVSDVRFHTASNGCALNEWLYRAYFSAALLRFLLVSSFMLLSPAYTCIYQNLDILGRFRYPALMSSVIV